MAASADCESKPCAVSLEARQFLQRGVQRLAEFLDPEAQNPGAGSNIYSKENSQYKAVARDRGKPKKPLKLLRLS
jgi:hypothetical protein